MQQYDTVVAQIHWKYSAEKKKLSDLKQVITISDANVAKISMKSALNEPCCFET